MEEFRNANTLAHAVNDSLGAPFVPRPYNRFSPDETVWWLVPCADWPAYKHGKLFFDNRPERIPGHQKGIFSGFGVEKGLSPRVREFYKNNKAVIEGDDWQWERFANRIIAEFPTLPTPQYISVSVCYIPFEKASYLHSPESFFAQKDSFEASRAVFTIDAEQHLTLLDMKVNDICADIAKHFDTEIRSAAKLSSLVAGLQTFPQSDWSWVNVYIGAVVNQGPIGKVWNEYLKPWSEWLGTSRSA